MTRVLDVDRMRRYRKGRVPSWLKFVRGPWPQEGLPVLVPDGVKRDLMDVQRRAGITVDGVLGPQTWVVLSAENERRP